MEDAKKKLCEQVALFRYGLIADLVHLEEGRPGIGQLIKQKAKRSYAIPGTLRSRVAEETMREWLRNYNKGGFDALIPKNRNDQGQSRSLPQPVVDLLLSLNGTRPQTFLHFYPPFRTFLS